MIDFSTVIFSLIPDAQCSYFGNKIVTWDDIRPQPSEEEIQAKIAELEAAEPMKLLREERNRLLFETDWRATVDYPGTDQESWLTYRRALRDLPANSSPSLDNNDKLTNVTWPAP
jgi:hypothetical protein